MIAQNGNIKVGVIIHFFNMFFKRNVKVGGVWGMEGAPDTAHFQNERSARVIALVPLIPNVL